MAYFEDLQPCTLFPGASNGVLAVGWLARGHDFTRGPVDLALFRTLRGAGNGWPLASGPPGSHRCDLCREGEIARSGAGVIFIRGDGVLYVAPRLITHYIRHHGYAPPDAFCRAISSRPQPLPAGYFREIGEEFFPARAPAPVPEPAPAKARLAYNAADIVVLEGLEPVRMRPGMYVGSTNSSALEHMLMEVVGNSVDEYLAGAATRIQVDVDEIGWTTIEDDGRGIPIDPHPTIMEASSLEIVFTMLHSGATFDGHHPHVHITHGLSGVGLAPVNALCARLEVESRREGVAYTAAFEAGRPVEPLHSAGETPSKGTRIRYLPDDEIFDEGSRLDLVRLEKRFVELAWLCPRLDLLLQGRSLKRPGGLPAWVRELTPDAVKESALSAIGTVNEVEVELALAWSPSGTGPRVLSFVNYASLTEGGSQEEGLLAAIKASAPDPPSGEKLLAGLVAVVHVGMLHPRFRGPIRAALEVDEARTALIEVVRRAIAAAPWWWDRLHEQIK